MKAVAVRSRIQLRNILFATDFSPAAANALPFAAEIAQRFGANLFAVHARTPENYALPVTEIWPATQALLDEQINQLKQTLHTRFPGVRSEVLLADGGVCAVVEAAARQKNADLIVVGTSGRRGIGKFILGSAAEEILRRARCPVLTVGPYSPSDPPREARFKRILYATDFGDAAPAAAAFAVALAQEHQAHLVLLHVIEHPKVGELVRPAELQAAALQRLQAMVGPEAELWCEPKAIVRQGAPPEQILEVAEQDQADLIVLGLRNTTGVISATHLPTAVARQVISRAPCPVLTVRA
jgi:nucleotide-binding universal stress UspA family protein